MWNSSKILLVLTINNLIQSLNSLELCSLPVGCDFKPINAIDNPSASEFYSNTDITGIKYTVKDSTYQFSFLKWLVNVYNQTTNSLNCDMNNTTENCIIELKWPSRQSFIMKNSFSIIDLVKFMNFINCRFNLRFTNVNGFETHLFNVDYSNLAYSTILDARMIRSMEFVNTRFSFYSNGRAVNSCRDLYLLNLTDPRSIFQVRPMFGSDEFVLLKSRFNDVICPLLFKNVEVFKIFIIGMSNLFFKRNVLAFSNDIIDNLNSSIQTLVLFKTENIDIDLSLLHPSVFKELATIYSYGHINTIDANLFVYLANLNYLQIEASYSRRLLHKGIDWIRNINKEININLTNLSEINEYFMYRKNVKFRFVKDQSVVEIFPGEDFCLYKDFPFNQLVIISQLVEVLPDMPFLVDFTCTFLWLIKYWPILVDFFPNNSYTLEIMRRTIAADSYRPKCDFERLLSLFFLKSRLCLFRLLM
jgi:hypothetical protein